MYFNSKIEGMIKMEVEKILASNIIYPIQYSYWIDNIIPVRKKNKDIIICIYF